MPIGGEEVRVVEQALLDEAAKWSKLSDDMAKVQHGIDGLALTMTAFFTNNPLTAQMAKNAYDGVWQLMSKLAGQASTEFDQINQALRRAHDDYQATDGKVAYDLSRIYGK
jgi:hypothetical protein